MSQACSTMAASHPVFFTQPFPVVIQPIRKSSQLRLVCKSEGAFSHILILQLSPSQKHLLSETSVTQDSSTVTSIHYFLETQPPPSLVVQVVRYSLQSSSVNNRGAFSQVRSKHFSTFQKHG